MARSRRRRSYHHGDLRRAVLDASIELVRAEGVGALSMREVCRRAGVTHGAPYHHFPDRAAILSAISDEGFTILGAHLRDAAARHDAPGDQLEAAGRAYVAFAQHHPAHFRVMFRPELSMHDVTSNVELPAAAAFSVLVEIVVRCQSAGLAASGDPMPLVITAWCTAHGLAALWLDGPLARGIAGASTNIDELSALVGRTLRDMVIAHASAERHPPTFERVRRPR